MLAFPGSSNTECPVEGTFPFIAPSFACVPRCLEWVHLLYLTGKNEAPIVGVMLIKDTHISQRRESTNKHTSEATAPTRFTPKLYRIPPRARTITLVGRVAKCCDQHIYGNTHDLKTSDL